ncbi:TIGR02679 domain-containing protein [Enterococcus sp. LJL51]|uniref:TIGR02679 domain-containing protein n=1 Tax=Enterococcus sp. LJL51 TaxID=3416656 RepID=UPI003CE75838
MSEAEAYIKQPVFQILAKELWRRYWLKGTFGSSIGLSLFSQTDTEPLRSFLGITVFSWDRKKRIRVVELDHAFVESSLNLTLADFVVLVMKKPLVLKIDYERLEKDAFEQFKKAVAKVDSTFTSLLSERQLKEWWKKQLPNLIIFEQVSVGLQCLPKKEFVRLPVFAYKVTGNPHAFDENTEGGQLLLQMLAALSNQEPNSLTELEKTEQRHGLLNEFHLLKDDIMNYAAIRGLAAQDFEKRENQMWRQACIEGISWNVPLKEILRTAVIRPYVGEKVLVVENSGIYSILVELLPKVPILCSSGHFTFAIWQLLRKLADTGTIIYYSGDLDPEGLGMAQKLKNTFGSQLQFLGMEQRNFQIAKTKVALSSSRLKKLQALENYQLAELGKLIDESKQVAYQEGFLQELIKEIECEFVIETVEQDT